jgi:hypothetical protein
MDNDWVTGVSDEKKVFLFPANLQAAGMSYRS